MGAFDSRIASEEFWSSVGYWILVAGLVGDIIVLVVPRHRERLEKILAAFFTVVIIVGVAIEHRADASISVLVSQEEKQASEAQSALKEYLEAKTNPRWRNLIINSDAVVKSLKGNATSEFEILFVRDDEKGFTFATVLSGILKTAGWRLSEIRPLRDPDALEGTWHIPNAPLAVNAGAWWGISFNVKSPPPYPPFGHEKDCPVCALVAALPGGFQIVTDPRLPEGIVRIVIGQGQ
jgi:hypothetical protein